jgi:hypothetical protein
MGRETRELVAVFGQRFEKELVVDATLPAPIALLLARLQEAARKPGASAG